MSEKTFNGEIKAKIVEVRFPFSGKTVKVFKKTGETVKKNEPLASLEQKTLQIELDRQLAEYEKVRADFEIFNLKHPQVSDDLTKYLKTEKQAQLNKSVKEVELTKARLDQCNLYSPVEGLIIDDSNLVSNLYITASSNPFKIINASSFFFEVEVKQKDISFFTKTRIGKINITGLKKQHSVKTGPILADGKRFYLQIDIPDKKDLFLGAKGEITFKG